MYRGYKTYRHYLNAKLHALSAVICGDDELLDAWLEERKYSSVKEIPLPEAESLYKQLVDRALPSVKTHNKALQIVGLKMTDRQYRMILGKIKYEFGWSTEAAFSYILETFPHLRKRLSNWEIENSKIGRLYQMLSAKDADKLIKRLLSIKKWNEAHNEKNN